MPRERTFIMIKPDGVQRGLVAKIITRFEEKGFKLVSTLLARTHSAHPSSSRLPFFPEAAFHPESSACRPGTLPGLSRRGGGARLPVRSRTGGHCPCCACESSELEGIVLEFDRTHHVCRSR